MTATFRLARIAGIDIGVHYTWLFAFVLITWSLARGFFPSWYEGWSEMEYWGVSALSAVLLFASVLLHELAHSFVAMARGLAVPSITLFIFGGVSNISSEAERPRDEFAIAVVGPMTSLVLAAIFWLVVFTRGDDNGLFTAVVAYLATINTLLGIFNLIPGFPLDGGRVLRSILWSTTRSFVRATEVASSVGQAVGWLFIVFGVFQVLNDNFLGGLWIAFVGWFLNGAADASRQSVRTQEGLRGVQVGQLMYPAPHSIEPDALLTELVGDFFVRRGRRAAPVRNGDRLEGIVTLSDIKDIPQEDWELTTVRQVMTRMPLFMAHPDENVSSAMKVMAEQELNQLLVMESGNLVGLLSRADIIRYLQFQETSRRREPPAEEY